MSSANDARELARTLFVDDDAATRRAFARTLGRYGLLIDLAADGEEALDLAEHTPYPVIVTDLAMPGMDGLSLIRRLRARQPLAQFIIVTGRANVELPQDSAVTPAVAAVVQKPWSVDEVLEAIRRAVRIHDSLKGPLAGHIAVESEALLLVEDNEADADLIRYYLPSEQSTSLVVVDCLGDALALLGQRSFAAVLCDLSLPDARGLDTVLRLQNADPRCPLIVLSSAGGDQLAAEAVGAGAQDFLHKDELTAATLGRAIRYARERKRAELRLAHQAHFDALTGTPNRLLFHERLAHAHARARRRGGWIAVMFVDMDRFRNINAEHGSEIGDAVLCEVAQRLQSIMREYDTVARLGGDEFAVLLDALSSAEEVTRIAERILNTTRRPFLIGSLKIQTSCSVGIALMPESSDTVEGLVRAADAAVYRAKSRGRNTYELQREKHGSTAPPGLDFKVALKAALEREEFSLYYQPQYDVRHGKTVAVEALLRWHRNGKRLVPPSEFIPTLEETGDIRWVGAWALRTACLDLIKMRQRGIPIERVSVNLSAAQLGERTLPDMVHDAMTEAGLREGELELEVTESALMHDTDAACKILGDLRRLGARIALDDFGTGYSSLAYLHRLPCSVLKIDRSFVMDLGHGREADAITTTIVKLGKSLGLEIVAEGVETETQRDYLERQGCDLLQGYLIGRPVPVDQLSPEPYVRRQMPLFG